MSKLKLIKLLDIHTLLTRNDTKFFSWIFGIVTFRHDLYDKILLKWSYRRTDLPRKRAM